MRKCLAAFLFVVLSGSAFAQSVGTINGRVTDPAGAIIPGVSVTAVNTVLANCDLIAVVTNPTVAGIEHTRCRLDAISTIGPDAFVLLVDDRPYGTTEIEDAVGVPVIGPLTVDARGAMSVYSGAPRTARKSALCRSARAAFEQLSELTARPEVPA